jgi:hypothetical protein
MLEIKKEDAQAILDHFTTKPQIFAEVNKFIQILVNLKPVAVDHKETKTKPVPVKEAK